MTYDGIYIDFYIFIYKYILTDTLILFPKS